MAPDPPSQKRKRGRPPNASRQEADATQDRTAAADEYDADADEERRLKKRGRRRKSMDSVTEEQPAPRDSTEPKRKRGRPSLGKSKTTQASIVEDGDVAPPAKRKRGRPSLSNREVEVAVTEEAGPSSRNKRKNASQDGQTQEHQDAESRADPRERRSRRHAEKNHQPQEPQQQEEDIQATEPPPRRKRGRPSLQSRQEVGENSEQTEEPRNPRKRGRPSLQDMPPSEVQNKTAKPSKSVRPSKDDETAAIDNTQSKKEGKRRGRSGGGRVPTGRTDEPQPTRPEPEPEAEPEAVESNAEPTESSQLQKKKRRRSNQNADPEDDFPPSPPKPYPHIAPYVRHVRQSIIEAKWSPLAESSLSAASAILHLAHRPILQRLSNTQQRRTHTSDALRLLTNRITRKVARGLPFPPASMTARAPRSSRAAAAADDGGRAVELDFESVLDAKQALERQLDPALHAVELLTREKEKLERELERDYEALRNLESSAKAQAREHRGLLKKAHILAPTPETVASQRRAKEESDVIFRHEGPLVVEGLFDDLKDEELKSLALQLGDHMESMKNNLQQTEGIIPQLARSRAALQDVLLRHLDQGQYEHVVLG